MNSNVLLNLTKCFMAYAKNECKPNTKELEQKITENELKISISKDVLVGILQDDIEKIVSLGKTIDIAYGKAIKGDDISKRAADNAINENANTKEKLKNAKGVIINIIGGDDLTLFDVHQIANTVQDAVSDETDVIFGALNNQNREEVEVTIIIVNE